jgi:pimeloyl-ACP methyl ester carboxylesterase
MEPEPDMDQESEDLNDPLASVRELNLEAERTETPCGDGTMIWRSWGEGPPLILLHGGAGAWNHWVYTVPAFSDTRRVMAPDLPGLGESADAPQPPAMAAIAGIVARGIDELIGPEASYDLVGFSFGASVGGHVALLHGARMRSLTLVGAGGLVRPHTPMVHERVRDKTGAARVEAHRTNLSRTIIADPTKIDELALAIQEWNVSRTRLDSPALIQKRPLAESLPQVRIPVNAIWGERDQIAYYKLDDRVAALRALYPNVELRIVPSAGHWVAYEAPEAFNTTLAELLQRTSRSA